MKDFKVNRFISLQLVDRKTIIFINDKPFKLCKFLLLNIPVEKVSALDEIKSVDEAAEDLDKSLEPINGRVEKIPPDVEFWGHCSNLQTWYEHNYDTRLLHSNLAFPMLKKLVKEGDSLAKKVFKEEIAERLETGVYSVVNYLINERYINYLNEEELLSCILNETDAKFVRQLKLLTDHDNFFDDKWIYRDINQENSIIIEKRKIVELRFWELFINEKEGSIPDSIGNLDKLRKIFLLDCNINKLPESIGKLKSLESLEAVNCSLTEIPDSIGNLKTLKKLNLGSNYLVRIPESFKNLVNLEELNLQNNQFKSIPKYLLELKNLKKSKI